MHRISHAHSGHPVTVAGLRHALLLGGAFAAILATPAVAQDNGGSMETVVVTGLRESLQRNLDIKRDSLGLVDAITTEDIGKFPDSNMATAMMRIPGVTISRGVTSSSGIGSSTGEPSQVTVRGFGPAFNETLIEGRKLPTAMSSRSFDFSSLNSDLISRLEVLKSPDASLSAGAIGATINIHYPKPLDNPGLRVAGSASGSISPTEGKWTPNGNFLVSDTFLNNRLGVLLAGSYTESKIRVNQVSNWGWEGTYIDPCQLKGATTACGATLTADQTRPVWFTQDTGMYVMHDRQMREELRGIVQYAPVDSVIFTLDGGINRSDLTQIQYAFAIWNNVGEMRDVQTSKNGTILSFVRKPGGLSNNVPSDFDGTYNDIVMQTYDLGLNAKWEVTDKLSITADAATAMAALSPGGQYTSAGADVGYGPSQTGGTNGATLGMVNSDSHQLPYYINYGPNGDASNFLNPNIMGSHVFTITSQQNRNSINQAKFEAKWDEDTFSVTGGFQYVANHIRMASYNTFANNQWQAFAGYGPASNNYYASGKAAGAALPASLFSQVVKIDKNFIPGWKGSSNLPSGLFAIDALAVKSYLESLGDPNKQAVPGFNYACCVDNSGKYTYDGQYHLALDANSWQQIFEDTYSGYIAVSTKTQFAGMPLKINAGVRSEYTDMNSKGLGKLPTSLKVSAADHTNFDVSYTDTVSVSKKNSYQYLLPNLDLTLQVSDNFQLRFDASRTLTRPPLNNVSPVTTYSSSERVGSLTATGSNPNLLPYTSDNLDLSAEWYYAQNSYLSGDVFLKSTKDFVISGTTSQAINNVIDPTTGSPAVWHVSAYVNGPSANVYGLELAWQHVFGDTGFGYQVNGTIVQTDKPYSPADLTSSNFAVTGLADSANLTAFYDKHGFEFRLAANWRDLYLDHFGQNQNASSFGTEPTFVNPSWSFDISTRYDITDQITAYAEVLNLLDASYSTRGRFSDQALDIVAYGRRFTMGFHFKL